ncbi:ATP-grasp domain-containing protein [Streptomyces bambusae]|uniref:ATP-grasp domain-containing protein n=1 Tax=Streptomyces bambusae TaxID=1550616 RepID=UPI001CFE0776|nr:ATP-grasp domain-containing protein [Streptomyces bambusae]MCB5164402.1 ATP-grasp domain-containing protein [Streptomyces bambusae]
MAPQYTTTSELLAAAARRRGMDVEVLPARGGAGGAAGRHGGHYYGGPAFAAHVADDLGVALLEPTDDWLAALPVAYTRRRITLATLGEARALPGPAFVKPPTAKTFPAAVYAVGRDLPTGPDLTADLPVQISDVVTWAAEFRLYVLDGEVRTGSQYATFGRLDSAPLHGHDREGAVLEFADGLLAACGAGLPSAVVVDVGLLSGPDRAAADAWAVVEANMAWFSNTYAADPDRALDVVLRAAGPRPRMAARDHRFCRAVRPSG